MVASDRPELIAELSHQARVGTMWTIPLHHAIAARSGINVTDLQCVSLLQLRGPMTPGQLAEAMFLTTGGAITAVVDRLEKAGFVHRRRDDPDRRKVMVSAAETGPIEELTRGFAPVSERCRKLLDEYTDEQLGLLLDHLTRANAAAPEVIEQVRNRGE